TSALFPYTTLFRSERLRVHARVLRPQDAEVACGKRDRRVPGAERADPRAGWNHDQAELAQPQEVTLLEEAADRAARMQTHQLRACLIVVRRVRIDQTCAVVAAGAADALAVVVDEVAALVIHHAGQAQLATQQVDAGRHRELPARHRVAVVLGGVADDDLVLRRIGDPGDQAIAILVLPAEELHRPPAVQRVALTALLRGAVDDVRLTAEA